MAKKSSVEKNENRRKLVQRYAEKRTRLRTTAKDKSLTMEERFNASMELAKLPRNSAPTRIRNRCEVTGRPRGFYRKMRVSRIALRELGAQGRIPGLVKSSW